MTPKGFFSYARGDDAGMDREITALRDRIASEISTLLGHDIDMFQDVYDIHAGDDWEARLRAELTSASFMIPVLTPRYFNRPWCRDEVMTFLRLAEEQGRRPLLFPVYLVRDRHLDSGDHCDVRAAVARFQHFDFRSLRFEVEDKARRRAIHGFAEAVSDALTARATFETSNERPATEGAAPPRTTALHGPRDNGRNADGAAAFRADVPVPASAAISRPVHAPETGIAPASQPPQDIIVSQQVREGDFTTITAAIEAAAPGMRLRIRAGTYVENVILDKAVDLVGEAGVIIAVCAGIPLDVGAPKGLLADIVFRRDLMHPLEARDGGGEPAVFVRAGTCQFLGCVFTSRSGNGVQLAGASAAPQFFESRFEQNARSGASLNAACKPVFKDCAFSANGEYGMKVCQGSEPQVWTSHFDGNAVSGLIVFENGYGNFWECEFSHNSVAGVETTSGGYPFLQSCKLIRNHQHGFAAWVSDGLGGQGHVEACVLGENGTGDWNLCGESVITQRGNSTT